MEKIITYVNNVFSSCPHTEEAARLKMQFIDTLIEKYQALLAEGKSEHEAFGMAIADFGDVEEIKKTLHADDSAETKITGTQLLDASGIIAVYREIQQTLKHNTRWELLYGIAGIGTLIVFTVIAAIFRYGLHTGFARDISSIGMFIFFVCMGFAAAHFLVYALRVLQIEKEICNLTGKQEEHHTASLFESLKKEGKPFAKKLQGSIFVITALLFLFLMITNGPFEVALFIAGMGVILYILIGIWMK